MKSVLSKPMPLPSQLWPNEGRGSRNSALLQDESL